MRNLQIINNLHQSIPVLDMKAILAKLPKAPIKIGLNPFDDENEQRAGWTHVTTSNKRYTLVCTTDNWYVYSVESLCSHIGCTSRATHEDETRCTRHFLV